MHKQVKLKTNSTKANILLVDDNEALLKLLGDILVDTGYIVTLAANGSEVGRLVEAGAYDLVITDIVMPEKDGLETIMDLRRQHPGLRIIAMSGGGRVISTNYLNLAEGFGAKATLVKPFSIPVFLETVARVLRFE